MNRDDRIEEIQAMLDGGMSVAAIAAEMKVSGSYVYKLMSDNGIPTRGKPGRKGPLDDYDEGDKDAIVSDYLSRKGTIRMVLDKWGITYQMMYRLLLEKGITPTSPEIVAEGEVRKMRLDLAVQMYEDGAPLWQIMDETGLAQPQITNELHIRGVELRSARRAKQATPAEIRREAWFQGEDGDDPTPDVVKPPLPPASGEREAKPEWGSTRGSDISPSPRE